MKYLACIEISTREGNMNLPQLPRCEMQAFLLDNYTDTRVPFKFEQTNVVKIYSKTCGSIQWLSAANLLLWSSFEPGRFTLYVERVRKADESENAQADVSLQITG